MLDKLLAIMNRGGTLTVDQIARELNTTPAMIDELIDHLMRSGWLKPMDASCDSSCHQCALASDCRRTNQSRIWQIMPR
jgi:hypothetical protein